MQETDWGIRKKREKWETFSEEAIDLLNICLNAKLKKNYDSEKGAGNVCRGIEEALEIVRAEAEAKGKAEGKAEGMLVTLLDLVRDGLLAISIGAQIGRASCRERVCLSV